SDFPGYDGSVARCRITRLLPSRTARLQDRSDFRVAAWIKFRLRRVNSAIMRQASLLITDWHRKGILRLKGKILACIWNVSRITVALLSSGGHFRVSVE